MSKRFTNIDGVTGTSFAIGITEDALVLEILNDVLNVSKAINLNDKKITTTAVPSRSEDLVNLLAMTNAISASEVDSAKYTDAKIQELTGGTAGTNIMLKPVSFEVANMTDGWSILLGTLITNKYIDRVIFEVSEAFTKADGTTYDISIGSSTDHEFVIPKFNMTKLASTYVMSVCRTIGKDTALSMYVTKHVDIPTPPPYTQRIENPHNTVTTTISTDASGNVYDMKFTGADLIGEVADVATFGVVTGDYMDFGVNLNLSEGHTYKIVQQNPALAYYPDDPNIANVGGIWTKTKTYTVAAADAKDFVYKFLLTKTTGATDYAHIVIYENDIALYSYHLKNELNYTVKAPMSPTSRMASTPDLMSATFGSIEEASMGITTHAPNQYTITLNGAIQSKVDVMQPYFPGIVGNWTYLTLHYNKPITDAGLRVIIYNPGFRAFYGSDPTVHVSHGVYHMDMTLKTPNNSGLKLEIPISDHKEYPITVVIVDLKTSDYLLVGVDNELAIMEPLASFSPDSAPVMKATPQVRQSRVGAPPVVDAGKGILRILSF